MRHLKGIILDWAGTAIDYGCFAPVNSFMRAFEAEGVQVTMDEAREPMGMLKWDHIETMLEMPRISEAWLEIHGAPPSKDDVQRIFDRFEPMLMETLADYTDPLPGVMETVTQIREMGLVIGSTTGYTDAMMEVVTRHARDKGYAPDAWVTPDATSGKGRPYPYMVYKNMELLGIPGSKHVVKIGDTLADVKEGLNAGVWTIGVAIGSSVMGLTQEEFDGLDTRDREMLIDRAKLRFIHAGAHDAIRDITQLPQLLKEIDKKLENGQRP